MASLQHNPPPRLAWIQLSAVLLYIFGFGMVNILGTSDVSSVHFNNPDTLLLFKILQVFGVIFIFILPAVLFACFWTEPKIHFLGLSSRPSLVSLGLAGLTLICALPLINFLAMWNSQLDLPASLDGVEAWMKRSEESANQLTEAFMQGTGIGDLILNLLVIAFMAALSEEIFFRGLLQNTLQAATRNVHVAVWSSAIIFSAFHLQFYGFVPRALMGVFLGYVYVYSGSLWVPIFAHFTNNGFAVIVSYLIKTGHMAPSTEDIGSSAEEIPYLVASILLTSLLFLAIYRWEKSRTAKALEHKKSTGLMENEEIV
jgi:uncharacterized protein